MKKNATPSLKIEDVGKGPATRLHLILVLIIMAVIDRGGSKYHIRNNTFPNVMETLERLFLQA